MPKKVLEDFLSERQNAKIYMRWVMRGIVILWVAAGVLVMASVVVEWQTSPEPMVINGEEAGDQEVYEFLLMIGWTTLVGGICFWFGLRRFNQSVDSHRVAHTTDQE